MQGNCVFEHCYFSGPLIKNKSGSFENPFPVKDSSGTTIFILLLAVPFLLTVLAVTFIFYYRKQIFWKIYYEGKQQTSKTGK